MRKSKRLVSRKFWGHEEEGGKEVLVPLEEPSREEEKVRLEAEKEEFAETLHAVGNEQEKEEYTETAARDSPTIKVTPENSLSEEREGDGRDSRMRRGRLPAVEKDTQQETVGDVKVHVQTQDLLRAASSMSRPSSQADSRPSSQNSRPGSALPAKVVKQLEQVASPDRNSPVLAPRHRQLVKEERERLSIDGQHVARPESRQASSSRSPARATGAPCDNYLKKNQKKVEVQTAIDAGDMLDQVYVRGAKSEKVRKQLEKLKKKASKNSKGEQKKYKGFGEKRAEREDKAKKREEKEKRRANMKIKKAEVTSIEAALIAELLQTGSHSPSGMRDIS